MRDPVRNLQEMAKDALHAHQHSNPFRVSPEEMHYLRHQFATNPDAERIWDQWASDHALKTHPLHGYPLAAIPVIVEWPITFASHERMATHGPL